MSALNYWLLGNGRRRSSRARLLKSTLPLGVASRLTVAESLELSELTGLSAPFDVAVSDRATRRGQRGLVYHVCENLPIACKFIETAPGLYVACPELALLQSAPKLAPRQIIKAGFELCATYQRGREGAPTCYNLDPLTTVSSIESIVEACSGMSGAKKLRKLTGYIRDGSASPQETVHALLLGLPLKLGGLGLGVPLMNYRITLNGQARMVAKKDFLKCDMYWPEHRYDVEFDSYEHHVNRESHIEDSLRREALALMGVSVMTVTAAQTKDMESIEALAKSIAKGMGRRLRPQRDYSKERKSLVELLKN